MKKFVYEIQDVLGIHARPAGMLVKEATNYECNVILKCGEKEKSVKTIMGIMTMNIKTGDEVTVICKGSDEIVASKELEQFFRTNL
ncbi:MULTISPECIES: HPr family phosphocarrier protein [unclassified Enterococcus]|uniref:HPr family phosphocarrier protein n=1 Tax=unclassified Enterococcus TaxID=2608891 RepID=UPI000A33FC51|nr:MULTISPECIES: HPr family phosphocarrier protein [unclassified Enterococcus]OTO77369.1 hypothetical protein A5865_001245 [Enterococcus sp. 12E11_DIV0728]OUZ16456.1 hypothetical protein A5868_001377 [Enterococcus sp. 12F9_DIV0723]